MKKQDKERVVADLTERLKNTETLLVADYRGLTMPQIDDLRTKLLEHGARFAVVKNTLTRRAAEASGSGGKSSRRSVRRWKFAEPATISTSAAARDSSPSG